MSERIRGKLTLKTQKKRYAENADHVSRYEKAAENLKSREIAVTLIALAQELNLSDERVREVVKETPGLAEKIGLEKHSEQREKEIRKAILALGESSRARTFKNLGEILSLTNQQLHDYFSNKPDLKIHLGIMSEYEFKIFKLRVAAAVLDDLKLPVTRSNLANLLVQPEVNIREFLARHPILIGELGVMYGYTRGGPRAARKIKPST